MALSEHEQRLLDDLEARLSAEDPRFAHLLAGTTPLVRRQHSRRGLLAALGLVAGLAGLVVGLQVHPVVCLMGFLVMLASVVCGLGIWSPRHDEQRRAARAMHPSNVHNRQAARAHHLDDQGHDQRLI